MRSKVTLFLIFVLLCLPVSNAGAAGTGGREQTVYVIPVYGEIDLGLAAFVKRSITSAERAGAAVLLEINTFGGLVEAATEIRDAVIRTPVPVMSYVSDRAWSAGALIALAAPHIAMAPGSSIGAAQPRPMDEKTVSAIRGEFEATAERAGRDRRIAAAMVDADVEIEELSPKGKLLTLSAQKALEFGYADAIAVSRSEALAQFGYTDAVVIEMELGWAERVARLVTNSTVSSLLLTLGFLGLIFEIATPGWGVPGTVGLISLGLFFGGRYIAGLVGIESIGLFALGFALLLLEIFVIPGFGVTGILGLLSMAVGIVMAFGSIQAGLTAFTIALAASLVAIVLLWSRIKKSRLFQRIILSHREEQTLGYQGPRDLSFLLGKHGRTLTPLRPAGTAMIDDERYDVVSEGGYMDPNKPVEVVKIEGTRVVVREISEQSEE